MKQQLKDWLASHAASGRGGVQLPQIDRGLPYSATIKVYADLSADGFSAALRVSPDDPGGVLQSFHVVVGPFENGVTDITLRLSAADVDALPADVNGDGLTWLCFEIVRSPAAAQQHRMLAGIVAVSGKVAG